MRLISTLFTVLILATACGQGQNTHSLSAEEQEFEYLGIDTSQLELEEGVPHALESNAMILFAEGVFVQPDSPAIEVQINGADERGNHTVARERGQKTTYPARLFSTYLGIDEDGNYRFQIDIWFGALPRLDDQGEPVRLSLGPTLHTDFGMAIIDFDQETWQVKRQNDKIVITKLK